MPPERLFVYGTLRGGLEPTGVAGRLHGARHLGDATLPGALYDLGDYPGAIPDPETHARVHGELIELADAADAFAWLDRYEGIDPDDPEGSLFRRERGRVLLAGGEPLDCWVYVYRGPVADRPRIAGGDWAAWRAERRS